MESEKRDIPVAGENRINVEKEGGRSSLSLCSTSVSEREKKIYERERGVDSLRILFDFDIVFQIGGDSFYLQIATGLR